MIGTSEAQIFSLKKYIISKNSLRKWSSISWTRIIKLLPMCLYETLRKIFFGNKNNARNSFEIWAKKQKRVWRKKIVWVVKRDFYVFEVVSWGIKIFDIFISLSFFCDFESEFFRRIVTAEVYVSRGTLEEKLFCEKKVCLYKRFGIQRWEFWSMTNTFRFLQSFYGKAKKILSLCPEKHLMKKVFFQRITDLQKVSDFQ